MQLFSNNLSPLPFHIQEAEQSHREPYAYGDVYPLLCPQDTLLPFQVFAHKDIVMKNGVSLRNENGRGLIWLTSTEGFTLYQKTYSECAVIYAPQTALSRLNLPIGRYYLVIEGAVNGSTIRYYSDMFTWIPPTNVPGTVRLMWNNSENIDFRGGGLVFEHDWYGMYYLNTRIGKPEYEFTEEGETRQGVFFPIKQISSKTYRCSFMANEAMCDALRAIRLCDTVQLIDQYGELYFCTNFLISPKWQEQGNLANVEVEFQTDTIIKQIGRGYNTLNKERGSDIFNTINLTPVETILRNSKLSDYIRCNTVLDWEVQSIT